MNAYTAASRTDLLVLTAALASLRDEAEVAGRLDWRLSVDAIDCRLFVLLLLILSGYAVRKFHHVRRLRVLVSTDELTWLPNRRAVIAHAEYLVRRIPRETGSLMFGSADSAEKSSSPSCRVSRWTMLHGSQSACATRLPPRR